MHSTSVQSRWVKIRAILNDAGRGTGLAERDNHKSRNEARYGVHELEFLQSDGGCGFRHSELGMSGMRWANGRTGSGVQVPGRMSNGLAPSVGSNAWVWAIDLRNKFTWSCTQ